MLRYPLHGRIANRPAHRVEVRVDAERGEISVTGEVEESRFLFYHLRLRSTVTTSFHSTSFRIRDQIENPSDVLTGMQLLYHINFGAPLLDAGARLVAPAKTVVPRDARAAEGVDTWDSYLGPQPGFAEQVYFFELLSDQSGRSRVLLKNAHSTQGVCVEFDTEQLPCFTQWKNTAAESQGYVTGLEPATNFPNPRSFEQQQGRVVPLPARSRREFEVALDWLLDADAVADAEKSVQKLQAGQKPIVHDKPQAGWCMV